MIFKFTCSPLIINLQIHFDFDFHPYSHVHPTPPRTHNIDPLSKVFINIEDSKRSHSHAHAAWPLHPLLILLLRVSLLTFFTFTMLIIHFVFLSSHFLSFHGRELNLVSPATGKFVFNNTLVLF